MTPPQQENHRVIRHDGATVKKHRRRTNTDGAPGGLDRGRRSNAAADFAGSDARAALPGAEGDEREAVRLRLPARQLRQVQEGRPGCPRAPHGPHAAIARAKRARATTRSWRRSRSRTRRRAQQPPAERSAEGRAGRVDADQGAQVRQGDDRRVLRLPVTLLLEGRSDPQEDRREVRQGRPRRVP